MPDKQVSELEMSHQLLSHPELVAKAMPVHIRHEIHNLNPTALANFRKAIAALEEKSGPGGYRDTAGIHGIPRFKCPHHTPLFLPWHRAYILTLERALSSQVAGVTLPYWDWASTLARTEGLPHAYTDPSTSAGPNPLLSAAGATGNATTRGPDPAPLLGSYASQVTLALGKPDFLSFSSAIEAPHDNVHVWVGGDMGSVPTAAYDPVFWAHHCNIDRYWTMWQVHNGNSTVPASLLQTVLDPFGVTVAQVLNWRTSLHYDYEARLVRFPLESILVTHVLDHLVDAEGARFRLEKLVAPERRVMLVAHNVEAAPESLRVRIFINQPDADATTALVGNPHFAGSFNVFGGHDMNTMHGEMPHMAHMQGGGGASLPPKDQVFDVTEQVKHLVGANQALEVKLVAVALDGKPVNASKIPIEGLSVETR